MNIRALVNRPPPPPSPSRGEWWVEVSPVALSHDDVVRAEDRHDVGDEIAARHVVERPQVDERRRADLQTIGFRPAVADDEKAQFSFRGLRGAVGLALGRLEALREDD